MPPSTPTPPAGPGALDFATLSRRLRDVHAFRLDSPAFAKLSPLGWFLFLALWHYFWGSASASCWPTQETLARDSGLSVRTVRMRVRELEKRGVIRTQRVPRASGKGGFKNVYYAGPALLDALAALGVRVDLKAPRAKPLGREAPGTRRRAHAAADAADPSPSSSSPTLSSSEASAEPPPKEEVQVEEQPEEAAPLRGSVALPEAVGGLMACEGGPGATPNGPSQEPLYEGTEHSPAPSDLSTAKAVLEARALRAHPEAAPPRWFDGESTRLVAERVAELPGTPEEQRASALDAVEGAFDASPRQTPTVRYLAGTTEHFTKHVAKGRALRREREAAEARARAPRRPAPATAPAAPRVGRNVAGCDVAAMSAAAAAALAALGW